jgi:hypothetical protein
MKETTVKKYVSALENLGYTVSKKVVKATPVTKERVKALTLKLAVKGLTAEVVKSGAINEQLVMVGKHFELGRSVRFNYGYKGKPHFVQCSSREELLNIIKNDTRRFYFVSVTLS